LSVHVDYDKQFCITAGFADKASHISIPVFSTTAYKPSTVVFDAGKKNEPSQELCRQSLRGFCPFQEHQQEQLLRVDIQYIEHTGQQQQLLPKKSSIPC